jgi:hypothetical protein
MTNDQVQIEIYGPADTNAQCVECFPTWIEALRFVKAYTRNAPKAFLRVFVPSSIATADQLNDLRLTLGLPAHY